MTNSTDIQTQVNNNLRSFFIVVIAVVAGAYFDDLIDKQLYTEQIHLFSIND